MDQRLKKSLSKVAEFYDQRKVGAVGPLGFRRSTDLITLLACVDRLIGEEIIKPDETAFLDLGCADGRVNLFFSYLVRLSVGIELDEWTLEEYDPLRGELANTLEKAGLLSPPANIFLFHGDSTDKTLHDTITRETGVGIESFDLFYTYLIMHEEFAEMLAERAKGGSIFMVYGLNTILPKYPGFRLLRDLSPMERILALYQKEA
jgi:SAM-dependent methyltransferase